MVVKNKMNDSLKTWGPYLVAAVMAFAAVKYTSAQNTKELDKQDAKLHLILLQEATLKTNVATTATKVEGIRRDVGKIEQDVDKIEEKVDDILKLLMKSS